MLGDEVELERAGLVAPCIGLPVFLAEDVQLYVLDQHNMLRHGDEPSRRGGDVGDYKEAYVISKRNLPGTYWCLLHKCTHVRWRDGEKKEEGGGERTRTERSPDRTPPQFAVPDGGLQANTPGADVPVDEEAVLVAVVDYLAVRRSELLIFRSPHPQTTRIPMYTC